jgi:membrane protein
VVLPIALNYLGLQNAADLVFRLARWPLLVALVIVGLAVLYRLGPSRREPRWQWISIGSVFAAIAWVISQRCCPGISRALLITTRPTAL